jgi:hypothetical protein
MSLRTTLCIALELKFLINRKSRAKLNDFILQDLAEMKLPSIYDGCCWFRTVFYLF